MSDELLYLAALPLGALLFALIGGMIGYNYGRTRDGAGWQRRFDEMSAAFNKLKDANDSLYATYLRVVEALQNKHPM